MKTIILCGGRGSRLQPLTDHVPKPLVPLNGKPILQHVVQNYSAKGFNEFVLCVGYKGEAIAEFVKTLEIDATFEISDAGENASMLERLHHARNFIGEQAFVAYGDTLIDVDLPAMAAQHLRQNAPLTITTATIQSPFGLINFDDAHRVQSFREKPQQWYFVGQMLLNKHILDTLPTALLEKPDGTGLVDLFQQLIQDNQLFAFEYAGPQITFNTPQELDEAERNFIAFFTQREA